MNKITVSALFLICIICVVAAGCGAGNMETRRSGSTDFDKEIDPFDFGDEFLHSTADDSGQDITTETGTNNFNTQTRNGLITSQEETIPETGDSGLFPQQNSDVTRAGFRVQIGAFDNRDNAEALAELARSRTDYPVYVEYLRPLYRVRVGDFILRSDAEECVEILKEKRFRDARWVPSNINSY